MPSIWLGVLAAGGNWFIQGWDEFGRVHVTDITVAVYEAAIGVAILFAGIHLIRRSLGGPPTRESSPEVVIDSDDGDEPVVERYDVVQRALYWAGAVVVAIWYWSEFALRHSAPTGLLGRPVLMSWTLWHTAATLALTGIIVAYLAVLWTRDEFWGVWPTRANLRTVGRAIRNFFGADDEYPRIGKYAPAQLLLYWMGAILVGVIMLFGAVRARRITMDPLWEATRQPFGLNQETVGMIFALRGVAFALLLGVIVLHVYLALRNWDVGRSIITGTISLETYRRYFDPGQWRPEGVEVVAEDGGLAHTEERPADHPSRGDGGQRQ